MEWLKTLYRWFFSDVKEDSQDKDSLLEQSKSNRESLKEQCKESVESASEKIFGAVHQDILRAVKKGDSSHLKFIRNFDTFIGGIELNNIEVEVLEEFILNKLKERYTDYFYVSVHVGTNKFPKSLSIYVSWER